jgi:hypothetical protein
MKPVRNFDQRINLVWSENDQVLRTWRADFIDRYNISEMNPIEINTKSAQHFNSYLESERTSESFKMRCSMPRGDFQIGWVVDHTPEAGSTMLSLIYCPNEKISQKPISSDFELMKARCSFNCSRIMKSMRIFCLESGWELMAQSSRRKWTETSSTFGWL